MIKISISYEDETEVKPVLELLKPITGSFRIKKSKGKAPYKHIYFTPKKSKNGDV